VAELIGMALELNRAMPAVGVAVLTRDELNTALGIRPPPAVNTIAPLSDTEFDIISGAHLQLQR